jgi:hypothetical protein
METINRELSYRPVISELRRVEDRFTDYATEESVKHIIMRMEGYVTLERYHVLKAD